MTKQHDSVSSSSQSSRNMARDPQRRYDDKPKQPRISTVVAVAEDERRKTFAAPEFGEIRMVFQHGRMIHIHVTATDNNVTF